MNELRALHLSGIVFLVAAMHGENAQQDLHKPRFPAVVEQGVDGFVVRFSDTLTEAANLAALDLCDQLENGAIAGLVEVASALASVFARFDGDPAAARADLEALAGKLHSQRSRVATPHRHWRVPAAFGGDDGPALSEIAGRIGISEQDAIRHVTSRPLRVLAIGFAPGQPYLGDLGPDWDIPRLRELTTVPKGALTIAIRQAVLFANRSPTGWSHIAQTGFSPFRMNADDPFALRPGDLMSFEPVSPSELADLVASDETGMGGATCRGTR